jgi:hypothetical protein
MDAKYASVCNGKYAGTILKREGQMVTLNLWDALMLVGCGLGGYELDEVIEVLEDDCRFFLTVESCVESVFSDLRKAGIYFKK